MNNSNNLVDNVIDAQSKTINNWMESTQKFQKAMAGGQLNEKGTDIYNEWLHNQMNIFNAANTNSSNATAETVNNAGHNFQDYYKNWYNAQMSSVKQMVDFNQNLYNSFLNFGKPTTQVNESFNTINNTWNNIYNSWMKTFNTSYENLVNTLPNGVTKDAFTNMFNSSNIYLKMQEVFEPFFKNVQNPNFNAENWKNMFDMNQYKQVTEKMFEAFFPQQNNKELFQNYFANLEQFFGKNSDTAKQYFEQYQNIMNQWPNLVSGDFAKANDWLKNYNSQVFEKTFAPVLKLVAPSKEKENVELLINTMDKLTVYTIKQAQMQYLLYTTGQKALEKSVEFASEKSKNTNVELNSFQSFFNEWVAINEKIYTDLFASDEFSKTKSEVVDLALGIKKDLEKQFEFNFEKFPLIFRTEMDELYKTIYDLKKKVKDLEGKLAAGNAASIEFDDEDTKTTKSKKK